MIKKPIPLFTSNISLEAADAVANIIRSGMINRGIQAQEFERMFMKMFKCPYAYSVNSCTSALRMAYDIIADLTPTWRKPPFEIITTPYTMVATNTAILECGFKPVFVDVEYETANIHPERIEDAITEHTIAIIGVDYAGAPCEWHRINKIAYDFDLKVVQDAAQAIGAKYHKQEICNLTDVTCYSFQAIKHITTGNGGMFVTIAPDIAELANSKIWFGINKAQRISDELGSRPEDIKTLGFKYGMNDIAATMGIYQLKDLTRILQYRKAIAMQYQEELKGVKDLTLMQYDKEIEGANWMFPIHVERRSKFAKKMRDAGIEVAVHNWRNDQYSIFGGLQDLPNTKKINDDLIHIPLHQNLTISEVEYIIKTIKGLKW